MEANVWINSTFHIPVFMVDNIFDINYPSNNVVVVALSN